MNLAVLPEWDDAAKLRGFLERRGGLDCDCDDSCVFARLRHRLNWLESL